MITVGHRSIRMTTEPLEDSLPPGMFAVDGPPGAQNALRAFRIVESIIRERSAINALTARFALLQSFPRMAEAAKSEYGSPTVVLEAPDFMRQYALALSPSWYGEYLAVLSEDQLEILLKHLLYAHETWGHAEGIGGLLRSMLEASAHAPVHVQVGALQGEERPIPREDLSLLGQRGQFALLGKDFVLGRNVFCRPERYDIRVGPLSRELLESFRKEGWVEGTQPSQKLERLVQFAEPFYLRARIRFLLESSTSAFELGHGVLGGGTLGNSTRDPL
jgi:hypothetical protein